MNIHQSPKWTLSGAFMIAAAGVILLAAGVRLHLLDAQSLWNDEGSAYVQATRTLPEIADNAARDIHPPGYYALLAVWRVLFGQTEFALRSLSAFAGVLTVALTYALGKRLVHPLAGVCAALFVALNTFNLYYSQEARMYALLALWSAAATWAFVGFIQGRDWRWGVGFALLNAAGLYTHYAYPAVMLMHGIVFVMGWGAQAWATRRVAPTPFNTMEQMRADTQRADTQRADTQRADTQRADTQRADTQRADTQVRPYFSLSTFRFPLSFPQPSSLSPHPLSFLSTFHFPLFTFFLANLLTLVLYLPWLGTALRQVTTWPSTGQPIPTGEALQIVFGWLSLGITYRDGTTSSAVIFLLLFGLLVLPYHRTQAQKSFPAWWAMLLPPVWVGVTVGAFLALSLFREANLKFLLPAQIGFALWMGRGVWVLWTLQPRRTAPLFQAAPRLAAVVGVISVGVALWSGLAPLYHAPPFQRDDYRGIVAAITANATPGDAIILNAPGQIEVFRYYYGERDNVYPLPIGLTVDADATLAAVRVIIAQYDRVYAVLWGTGERDPQNLVENTLDTEAYEIDNRWYGNVRLVRYGASEAMGAPIDLNAHFGDSIRLQAFAVSRGDSASRPNNLPTEGDPPGRPYDTITMPLTTVRPGDVLQLQITWMTTAPIPQDYAIFVQLLSPEGTLVAQRDSAPGGGTHPTSAWTPDETVRDHHALMIPHNLTAAHYSLIIGFYNPANSSERLPVMRMGRNGNEGAGDYLILGSIAVKGEGE